MDDLLLIRYKINWKHPEIFESNKVGDEEGCKWTDGVVTTPAGYKEAYKTFYELNQNQIRCDEIIT